MFDTYNVRAGDAHHSHTHNVTEKRAPTDESVRLLREMEAAARAAVDKTITLRDCEIDTKIEYVRDHTSLYDRFRMLYMLNGRRVVVQHNVDLTKFAASPDGRHELAQDLIEALAKSIARELLMKHAHLIAGAL